MWAASSLMQAESIMAGEFAIIRKSIGCYKLFLTSILLYLLADDVVWVLGWWMELKGWCGSCKGSSHKASADSKLAEVRSNHQAKHVDKTMSHPHIASAPCRCCIKEAQGIGCGEGGRWTVKSVVPRGGHCDNVNVSMGWWVTNISLIGQVVIAHLIASAHCRQGHNWHVRANSLSNCKW
jgi:hypothetical protein